MGLSNVTERYFVTGTDTEVGKTVASTALLQAARLLGKNTAGYKPVASGSEMTAEGLRNTDALALQRNSTRELAYSAVNPYTFAEPTSPHIVSADEGRPIDFTVLSAGLRTLESQADWVLVEGAGGWFTPLSDTQTFASGHSCRRRQAGLHQSRHVDRAGRTAGRAASCGLDSQRRGCAG